MNYVFLLYLKMLIAIANLVILLAAFISYIASTIIRNVRPITSIAQTR